MENILIDNIINNKYKIHSVIGNGKFGYIYSGGNIKTSLPVAIKFEKIDQQYKTLKNEATIIKYLYDNKCKTVPIIYWYGKYSDYYSLVLPKYDCSLQDYILNSKLDESEKNYIMLTMIDIISDVHNNFVIHRDIKPHHFMLKTNQLYLIDFGISTFYIDSNKRIKPNKYNDTIIGSSNYASYNLYEGNTFSRRDDLISISYIYIFMNNLELPWDNLNTFNNDSDIPLYNIQHPKNVQCKELKNLKHITCSYKSISTHFDAFITKCYSLEYYEEPNYIDYISMFHT